MKDNLVKAEILWTRKCPLSCSYCNMATGKENSRTLDEWKLGMDQLKELGVSFAAFYGAEPLADFNNLPEVINYAESIGISTTVITSGCVPNFTQKLNTLHALGATSLSMSYDMVSLESSSDAKSKNAIRDLTYFGSLPGVKNVAAIATVTRTNYMYLVDTVKKLSDFNIWTFFDFVHPDRGQMGSKCKGNAEEFVFRPEDIPGLQIVLQKLKDLKNKGALVHTSDSFMEHILKDNGNVLINFNWNCAKQEQFPSWVTIDCDGSVHYCDDFQELKHNRFDMTSIVANWDRFVSHGKELVSTRCRGCCWNTHMDAHAIKAGIFPISDYVHTEGE